MVHVERGEGEERKVRRRVQWAFAVADWVIARNDLFAPPPPHSAGEAVRWEVKLVLQPLPLVSWPTCRRSSPLSWAAIAQHLLAMLQRVQLRRRLRLRALRGVQRHATCPEGAMAGSVRCPQMAALARIGVRERILPWVEGVDRSWTLAPPRSCQHSELRERPPRKLRSAPAMMSPLVVRRQKVAAEVLQ